MAGVDDAGNLIRLYPVPFRLIADAAKFKKWQWISAKVEKATRDNRPESHRIGVDTIICDEGAVSTKNGWSARRQWLNKLPVFDRFDDLEQARQDTGITLGLLRPHRIVGLDIADSTVEWSAQEKLKLVQLQQQGSLFDKTDASSIAMLRKLPFDFYYRYFCVDSSGGVVERRHKIVDWEIGALFWNVRRKHESKWEPAFRQMLEQKLPSTDLMFLMGTIHRFPNQWLIISLIYPPKPQREVNDQISLF